MSRFRVSPVPEVQGCFPAFLKLQSLMPPTAACLISRLSASRDKIGSLPLQVGGDCPRSRLGSKQEPGTKVMAV